MKRASGGWSAALTGVATDLGVAASSFPASTVDVSETSVVDAIEDLDDAGDGVLGKVLKAGL